MTLWKTKHPYYWTDSDVLDFIYSSEDVSPETLCGERFRDLRGPDLCGLTVEQFVERDSQHGRRLYRCLHDIIAQFPGNSGGISLCQKISPPPRQAPTSYWSDASCQYGPVSIPQHVQELVEDDYSVTLMDSMITFSQHERTADASSKSSPTYTDLTSYPSNGTVEEYLPGCHQLPLHIDLAEKTGAGRKVKTKKKPQSGGVPRRTKRPNSTKIVCIRKAADTCEGGRGGHLWEFMRRLLTYSDSDTQRIIQWENRTDGVFRIVNSKQVAHLWGQQKRNRKTQMTYEKLGRALRWCREDGFLDEIPKNSGYPKKLCFRFGRKAVNWQDDL